MQNTNIRITDLEPKALWKHFAQICAIPHPSGQEGKLRDYMQSFAKKLGLESFTDEIGNLLIRKPATVGLENSKKIVLQCHFDMVPQKTEQSNHDFSKDSIMPYVDGNLVKARNTTLGADNGIGIAAIMALLESNDIKHGPIEALLTVDEEVSLSGAFGLKPDFINGDILLNLDTEQEGEFCIGSAGGVYVDAKFNFNEEAIAPNSAALKVKVSGLKGGHSGVDILYRANANKILVRFLCLLDEKFKIRIASFTGGNKVYNAIPREATATITVDPKFKTEIQSIAQDFASIIRREYIDDNGCIIEVEVTDLPDYVIDAVTQHNFLHAVNACINGLVRMSEAVPGLVETSSNLASIRFENKTITILTFPRSMFDTLVDAVSNSLKSAFTLANAAEVINFSKFPCWAPKANSAALQLIQKAYLEKFKKPAKVAAIHAGTECGILANIYPDIDIVSFGPTIRYPHSPMEEVDIESVAKFWELLVAILNQAVK